jgi:hypothetical protein
MVRFDSPRAMQACFGRGCGLRDAALKGAHVPPEQWVWPPGRLTPGTHRRRGKSCAAPDQSRLTPASPVPFRCGSHTRTPWVFWSACTSKGWSMHATVQRLLHTHLLALFRRQLHDRVVGWYEGCCAAPADDCCDGLLPVVRNEYARFCAAAVVLPCGSRNGAMSHPARPVAPAGPEL